MPIYLAQDPHAEAYSLPQPEPYQDIPLYRQDYTPADMDEDSMRIRSEDDLFAEDFRPVAQPQPVVETQTREVEQAPAGRGGVGFGGRGTSSEMRGSDRGRGRGRGGRGQVSAARTGGDTTMPRDQQPNGSSALHIAQPDSVNTESIEPVATNAPPTTAAAPTATATTPAVRGDRKRTGGTPHTRLTTSELEAKIAAIKLKNANLTAAHERAEADAASFAEREQQAAVQATQRQKVERRDRQVMMGERERNRERKLRGMEGREWDSHKGDEEVGPGTDRPLTGGRDEGRYDDGREYIYHEPREGDRGRGRGRGRGGRGDMKTRAQAPPRTEDFPALAPPPQQSMAANSVNREAVKSWADQVELSTS